jgi:hypothetical protein
MSRVRAICLVVPPGVSDYQADDEHNSGDDCDGDHEQYSPTCETHDVSFRVGELRTWRGPRAQNLVTPPCAPGAETGSQPRPCRPLLAAKQTREQLCGVVDRIGMAVHDRAD